MQASKDIELAIEKAIQDNITILPKMCNIETQTDVEAVSEKLKAGKKIKKKRTTYTVVSNESKTTPLSPTQNNNNNL